jgi:hypothetical protein
MEIVVVNINQFDKKLQTSKNNIDRAEDERWDIEDKDSNPSVCCAWFTAKVLDYDIPMGLGNVMECHDQARESEAHENLKSHTSPLLFPCGIHLSNGRELLKTPVNAENSSG